MKINSNTPLKVKIIVVAVMIAFGTIVWIYNPYRIQINRLEEQIPRYVLLEIDDQVYSEIDSFFIDHGYSYIKLSNDQRIALPHSRNHIYQPPFIGDQLQVGQQFIKNPDSDTILLIRDSKTIIFRLGEIINE